MKKYIVFILCCCLTLSVSKVMANNSNVVETKSSSNEVAYAVNLGNVTDISVETLNSEIENAFANSEMQATVARCSVTATVSVGVVSLAVTVEDDCDKIVEAAKRALKQVKMLAEELIG